PKYAENRPKCRPCRTEWRGSASFLENARIRLHTPPDQSSRADATALTARRQNRSRRLAAVGLAALAFCAAAQAREPKLRAPLSLRPSIPPPSSAIPLPRPRPVIAAPAQTAAE